MYGLLIVQKRDISLRLKEEMYRKVFKKSYEMFVRNMEI